MLKIGKKGCFETTVTESNTAAAMKSGSLPVFATPALAAAMEAASVACIEGDLEEGTTTVGTSLALKHISATPVGMQVTAEAELLQINGRKLLFKVTAFDGAGVIGEAKHERIIVQIERFLAKTKEKRRMEC